MDPISIIQKYYDVNSSIYTLLVTHSESVAKKALEIAKNVPHLHPDVQFIYEAAMLHDIGIFLTDTPNLDCYWDKPYICHGYLGREILEKEWFPQHALVCERHVGIGFSIQDIEKGNLPLPKRDMLPTSIEEQIVCFADKFFSKNKDFLTKEKNLDQIRADHLRFGWHKIDILEEWIEKFWKTK